MFPPCTVLNDRFLPTLRGLTARRLSRAGWAQSAIADTLGVSQGMVSKYLTRDLPMEPPGEMERLAAEAADLIMHGTDRAGLTDLVCKWCFAFKERGRLCEYHPVASCSVCMNLRSEENIGDRLRVLEDISEAIRHLENTGAGYLSPQVRINIARALGGAESSMDVAAIPGRLVPVAGGFRAIAPPEFGASRHLASLLLTTTGRQQDLRAVMNIRYEPGMDRWLKESPGVAYLDRAVYRDISSFIASEAWDGQEIIVDPGDFGIEPCTYVFGTSAVRVVDRVLSLFGQDPCGIPGEGEP